ncbi:hypothetical protein niasHS_001814 [Heterodera schachtii]|uniref:Uncharacterized protein n=1 Tax=Heterodera schachtii TaxID=97005 RepID=A0ABD2KAD5_HETSC
MMRFAFVFAGCFCLLAFPLVHATLSGCGDDEPSEYNCLTRGCDLIQCPVGKVCSSYIGIIKVGNGQFVRYETPRCLTVPDNSTIGAAGNYRPIAEGPGCKSVVCAEGYKCTVGASVEKIGDRPFAQSVSLPQCVVNGGSLKDVRIKIRGGPGCNQQVCLPGKTCTTFTEIFKNGHFPLEQYLSPRCI